MTSQPDSDLPVGRRIQRERQRVGMSRPVLAGLVDRSAEWLKAVEIGRLQAPRLGMLLKIAQALGLDDLATLTGNGFAVPVQVFAGERHAALSEVQAALTEYRVTTAATPPNVDHLAIRLDQAWQVRHTSPDHRTQLAALLPALLRDAQTAVRALRDDERRTARRILAGLYQLTNFYASYQPAPELVWMIADRALTEGQEADDPYSIALGAWAMVQPLRDAGRWDEAIVLATDAVQQLAPYLEDAPDDWRGMAGALEAELAYTHARRGRQGDAWAHLERAETVAQRLDTSYRHTPTSFSRPLIGAHATTLGVELRRPGEALQAAKAFDPAAIPSLGRRSRHLIEVARAHQLRNERAAVVAVLDDSERTAPETIRYNGYAREMLLGLLKRPPTGLHDEVHDLCGRVGLLAA